MTEEQLKKAMMTMNETTEQEHPVCPGCGHEHDDSSTWDYAGYTRCDECGFPFSWQRIEDADCIDGRWVDQSTYTTWSEEGGGL